MATKRRKKSAGRGKVAQRAVTVRKTKRRARKSKKDLLDKMLAIFD